MLASVLPILKKPFRYLAFRVVAFSTVWAVLALVVIATIISTLFRQASERGFESLLTAHLFNLISSVGVDADGRLSGSPNLGDLRFTIPNSGWYWSVEPVSEDVKGRLQSLSLTGDLPSPPIDEFPFNSEYQRSYLADGLDGETIEVFESEFVLAGENSIARFRVMGNRTELEEDIASFERQLYLSLLIFGLGMIAINAIAILIGLNPLRRVREALAEIRAGQAHRLDGVFPAEIAPLADETNALIDNNRRIVERSRTQVGNLAHSLKTPLAVLTNEARAIGGKKGQLIAEQAGAMQQQVEHYLQRARMAAQRDTIVFRTPVRQVIERMVRVMAKLNPRIDLSLDAPDEELIFAGEREDLEEIAGNLLENAMKWGREQVAATIEAGPGEASQRTFRLIVDDDGPGIPEECRRDALVRGRRLDETKPGTGLGLSIVADLVKEYGGEIVLSRSPWGGLRASVTLKRAQQ
ncbi:MULTISPECIES: ATP-binding protein [unclassified Aminobacter]|uniref:ATP-binding protein n=1 Tax=unclassified Aminobacter TaxID=2644704 RepID=UPI000464EF48|nr:MULTISPECIES: ATP-binding protein [unclassified Aminobacter]TWH35952.1 signal transduction histidine kinase [Aminobacter sp. J15]